MTCSSLPSKICKVFFIEAGDQAVHRVSDGDRHEHQIDVHFHGARKRAKTGIHGDAGTAHWRFFRLGCFGANMYVVIQGRLRRYRLSSYHEQKSSQRSEGG